MKFELDLAKFWLGPTRNHHPHSPPPYIHHATTNLAATIVAAIIITFSWLLTTLPHYRLAISSAISPSPLTLAATWRCTAAGGSPL